MTDTHRLDTTVPDANTDDSPTVLLPRHAKKVTPSDRFAVNWPQYRRRIRNTVLIVAAFIAYGMALTDSDRPISDACSTVSLTAPSDVNQDGYIDCRSPLERGDQR